MAHNPLVGNPGESDTKTVRSLTALKLRTQGKSYATIAAEMGISVATAFNYVSDALAETRKEIGGVALDLIALELDRLDKLQEAAWSKATDPDKPNINAAYFCLAVIDKRMKLLGLEPPQNVNISQTVETKELTDGQRKERIAELLEAARVRMLAAPPGGQVIEQVPAKRQESK